MRSQRTAKHGSKDGRLMRLTRNCEGRVQGLLGTYLGGSQAVVMCSVGMERLDIEVESRVGIKYLVYSG